MSEQRSYIISVSAGTGCYRHIRIDASAQLLELHEAILDAFEFFDDHAHVFFMDNRAWSTGPNAYYAPFMREEDLDLGEENRYTDEVTLDDLDLYPDKRFLYIFDFGDEWRFNCRVLKALPEATDAPEVVRSVGDPPEQYPDYDDEDWDEDEDDEDWDEDEDDEDWDDEDEDDEEE